MLKNIEPLLESRVSGTAILTKTLRTKSSASVLELMVLRIGKYCAYFVKRSINIRITLYF